MRRTNSRPHSLAMSVAFEDQGEMVPRRGVTSTTCPPAGAGAAAGP